VFLYFQLTIWHKITIISQYWDWLLSLIISKIKNAYYIENNMKNIGIDQFVQILAEFDEGQINSDFLIQKKRQFARENKLTALPSNIELLATYRKLVAE
jgi:hypothetical protein